MDGEIGIRNIPPTTHLGGTNLAPPLTTSMLEVEYAVHLTVVQDMCVLGILSCYFNPLMGSYSTLEPVSA